MHNLEQGGNKPNRHASDAPLSGEVKEKLDTYEAEGLSMSEIAKAFNADSNVTLPLNRVQLYFKQKRNRAMKIAFNDADIA